MTQHHSHKEKQEDYKSLYLIVGLLGGLFVGVIIDYGMIWIPILAIFGYLFAAVFYKLLVEGRADL